MTSRTAGGSTPPAATVYRTLEGNEGWKCTICGYVAEKETLPEGVSMSHLPGQSGQIRQAVSGPEKRA